MTSPMLTYLLSGNSILRMGICMQRDFLGAYSELSNNYSTGTAIGTALSVAAELCHAQDTGLIMGLDNAGHPDRTHAAHGGWTHGGYAIGPDNYKLSTSAWPADPSSNNARDTLTGYNFRKLTPLHCTSTGRVSALFRINTFSDLETVEIGWGTRAPTHHMNGYGIPTLSSAMRLSIATNLVEIGHQSYHFTSAAGTAGWLSMNAAALAFSFSVHLASSSFSLRDWLGYSQLNDDTTIVQIVNHDIHKCVGDIVIPTRLADLTSLVPGGAWDNIYEYDLLDPLTNEDY